MFVRCLALFRKCAPSAGVLALLLIARSSAISAEPIQSSKPAQKPEATPEKKSILSYRAYRPSDSISGSPNINQSLPVPVVPNPAVPPPRTSRQNQDLLDRQKNWIFASPENEKKTDSATDAFGVDEYSLDGGKSKSVVTKFLENRESRDAKISANEKRDKDQKNGLGNPQSFGLGNEKQNRNGNSLQQDLSEKRSFESGSRELSLPGLWREQNGARADKMREEKQIQMNEFRNLFSAQGASSTGPNNFGLQSGDALSGGGNRSSAPYKVPDAINNLPRAGGGSSAAASPNINTRVFGPSAAPAPAPETKKLAPQPSVLPIPKRHL